MQAMYDLVGDRLREIFDAQVVDIGILDREAGLIHFPYTIERGVRFPDEPIALIGFRKHVDGDARAAARQRALAERARRGSGSRSCSRARRRSRRLCVPLLVGGEATGVISLQNLDREHAFTDVGRSRC